MKLNELTIKEYSELLAAKKGIPGGGSALALVCELAIDLALMVANFTINKKGYETVNDQVSNIIEALNALKVEAHDLINKDSEAYLMVIDAFKSGDKKQLNIASIAACEVPYRLYHNALKCREINQLLLKIGNKNISPDADMGLTLSEAVLRGCLINIRCNIDNITDQNKKDTFLSILK